MGNIFLLSLTALFFTLQGEQAYASSAYAELVVFGDSLSDSGNVFELTTGSPDHLQDPPSPPYFDGRATNGPNWIDYFADQLGIPRPTAYLQSASGTNYAFAGAATGGGASTRFPSPTSPQNTPLTVDNVGTQIESFLTNNQSFQQNQLVTLWAGAGDLKGITGPTDIITIVDNLESHIRTLNNNGATTVVIPNQLDSGLAPFFDFPNTPNPVAISGAVQLFNNLLHNRLTSLSEDPLLDIKIINIDMFSLIQQQLNNNEFINVENSWLIDFSKGTAESNNPNDYLFFDEIHPTSRAHNLIANKIFSTVFSIPTPPTIFLLFAGFFILNFQRVKA